MNTTIPDLWPANFGITQQPSPASILRQQAHLLGQRTQNFVVGEVDSRPDGSNEFIHTFHLTASLLDFRQALLHARHGVDHYPVELAIYDENGSHIAKSTIPDAAQFMSELRKHLASERIVRLVRSLVGQCRDFDEPQ
jgi:hypothetical protein